MMVLPKSIFRIQRAAPGHEPLQPPKRRCSVVVEARKINVKELKRDKRIALKKKGTSVSHGAMPLTTKERKEVIVSRAKDLMENASLIAAVNFNNTTVKDVTLLRHSLPNGVRAMNIKNSLFKKANQSLGDAGGTAFMSLTKLKGPQYYIIIEKEDDIAPTIQAVRKAQQRQRVDLGKEDPGFSFSGGAMSGGDLLEPKSVNDLKDMPTRPQLMAMVAGAVNSFATQVASGVKAVPSKLAVAVSETAKTKSPESP